MKKQLEFLIRESLMARYQKLEVVGEEVEEYPNERSEGGWNSMNLYEEIKMYLLGLSWVGLVLGIAVLLHLKAW